MLEVHSNPLSPRTDPQCRDPREPCLGKYPIRGARLSNRVGAGPRTRALPHSYNCVCIAFDIPPFLRSVQRRGRRQCGCHAHLLAVQRRETTGWGSLPKPRSRSWSLPPANSASAKVRRLSGRPHRRAEVDQEAACRTAGPLNSVTHTPPRQEAPCPGNSLATWLTLRSSPAAQRTPPSGTR